jgi:hypothetical protein
MARYPAHWPPISPTFVVVNGYGYEWYSCSRAGDAEREARRIRKLHRGPMKLAYPMPITVWSRIETKDEIRKSRIVGTWEQPCRCCPGGRTG